MSITAQGRCVQRMRLGLDKRIVQVQCVGCGALLVTAEEADLYQITHRVNCPEVAAVEDLFPGPLTSRGDGEHPHGYREAGER